LSEYEFVQYTMPTGETTHRVKKKYKKTGESIVYRCILDIPIDDSLCEIIEEFGIPIFRKKGLNYKIRYVARKHLEKKLDIEPRKFRFHEARVVWIHDKEVLTKKEYEAQKLGGTQFPLTFHPSLPILYSLGDAIQILSKLQSDEKKAKLIRRLIIKLEELQKKLNKYQKEEIKNLNSLLEQLDDISYDWIKEHGEDYWKGYIMLWDCQLWQMIIDIHYRIRQLLGLPIPKKENTGLHHRDRPYRKVYPHVATRGKLIDNRFEHEDPRQKKYY